MTQKELKQQFQRVVKGQNFMTPDVVKYVKIENGVVELSEGTGFRHEPIYGVTVVRDGENQHELSKCCNSMEEAMTYIETLK